MTQGAGRSFYAHVAPPALSAVLFLASMALPPLAMFAAAPLYYSIVSHGHKAGAGWAVVAAMAVFLIGGPAVAAIYIGTCVSAAFALSSSFFKDDSLERTLAKAAIVSSLAGFAVFYAAVEMSGGNAIDAPQRIAGMAVHTAMESYKQVNADPEVINWLSENGKSLAEVFARLFPSMAFLSALTMAAMNIMAIRAASLRFGLGIYFKNHSLAELRASDWLVWGVVAGGAGSMFAEGAAQTVALNVLICVMGAYMVQGLALIHYFFMKAQVHVILRAIGYFVIFSQPPLILVMSGLGLMDVWAEFRKKKTDTPEEQS
ncbi:MAG: DUF2232 domain-containing protein [Nitrospinae bacterium]|nr:DUF2232 domain-containing protein [Nitrospinota bacterium]